MKKIISVILGTAFVMNVAWAAEGDADAGIASPQETAAEVQLASAVPDRQENANEPAAVLPRTTAIVMLGSERYLQAEYQDILRRYFVKCYSQYRFPTEYGWKAQRNFSKAYSEANGGRELQDLSTDEWAEILERMGKEQVLLLSVHDHVYKKVRRLDWRLGSNDTWDAVVYLEAALISKNGIVSQKNFQYIVEGQYTPSKAVGDAYTRCIRQLQKSDIFGQK